MLLLCLFFVGFSHAWNPKEGYAIPEPKIEIFTPKGFRVSIPHKDGVELFAFHGNVNEPMKGYSAGQFSVDVTESKNGFWVFEDYDAELVPGDTIYFWLFVIRNRLGYRYDHGRYVVQEFSTGKLDNDDRINEKKTKCDKPSPTMITIDDLINNNQNINNQNNAKCDSGLHTDPTCQKVLLNLTDTLLTNLNELETLRNANVLLKDVLEKAPNSKRIKFTGKIPYGSNDARYVAVNILKSRLKVLTPVIEANFEKDGTLTVDLASLDDKLRIVNSAKENLKDNVLKIEY